MKLNTPDNVLLTSNTQRQGFTIEASAKAFDVLSSKMYEEPILAIVRELSCNAYDSHVEAGKADVPFRVHLPTTFEPWLELQDFGVGLPVSSAEVETRIDQVTNELGTLNRFSIYVGTDMVPDGKLTLFKHVYDEHRKVLAKITDWDTETGVLYTDRFVTEGEVHFDAVLDLYTSYFSSTKTQSNDVIGAFGLGSKTPFAYVDAFTVTNIYDGYKYKYSIVKDSNGPEISLITVVEVEDENGLTIHMPIKTSDSWDFRTAAERTYKWFDVKPECNIELEFETPVWEGKNFSLYQNTCTYTSKRAYIKQGQVAYELSLSKVPGSDHSLFAQLKDDLDIVYHFDIGDIDVSASRESVHFCDMTNQSIIVRTQATLEEVNEYAMEKYTACTNLYELGSDYMFRTFYKAIELGGKPLTDMSVAVDFGTVKGVDGFLHPVRMSYNTWRERPQRTSAKKIPWKNKPVFVYKDKVNPTNHRIVQFYSDEFTDVILVNKRDMPWEQFESTIKGFNITDPHIVKSSEIPFPKAERDVMSAPRSAPRISFTTYTKSAGYENIDIDNKQDAVDHVQDMIDDGVNVILWSGYGKEPGWYEAYTICERLYPDDDFVLVTSRYKRVYDVLCKNFSHLKTNSETLYTLRRNHIEAEQDVLYAVGVRDIITNQLSRILFANILTKRDYYVNVLPELQIDESVVKFGVRTKQTDRKLTRLRQEIRGYTNLYAPDKKWVTDKYPMLGVTNGWAVYANPNVIESYIKLVDKEEAVSE